MIQNDLHDACRFLSLFFWTILPLHILQCLHCCVCVCMCWWDGKCVLSKYCTIVYIVFLGGTLMAGCHHLWTSKKVLGQERMAVHDVHAMLAAKWFFQQDGSRKKTVDAQTSFFFARSKNGARTTYARKSAVPAQSQNVASMSPVDLETYRAQCPPNRTSKIPAWTVSCTKIPPG